MAKFFERLKEKTSNLVKKAAVPFDVNKDGQIKFGEVVSTVGKAIIKPQVEKTKQTIGFLNEKKKGTGKVTLGNVATASAAPIAGETIPWTMPVTKAAAKIGAELVTKPALRAAASTALSAQDTKLGSKLFKKDVNIKASPLTKSLFGEGYTEEKPGEVYSLQKTSERAQANKGLAGDITRFVSKQTGVKDKFVAPAVVGLVTLADLFPENPFKVSKALKGEQFVTHLATKYGDDAVKIFKTLERGNSVTNAKPEILDAVIKEISKASKIQPDLGSLISKIEKGEIGLTPRKGEVVKTLGDDLVSIEKPTTIGEVMDIKGTTAEKQRLASLNLEKIKTGEDVRTVIDNMSKEMTEKFAEQTRGVISFEKATEMSKLVAMTPEKLMNLPKGSMLNTETMEAARSLLTSSAEKLTDVIKLVNENPTPEVLAKFQETLTTHTEIQKAVTGVKAELGRALGSMRKEVGATSQSAQTLQKYFEIQNRMMVATGQGTPEQATIEFAKKLSQVAENPEEISRMVAEINKPTFLSKIVEFSVAAKLWWPTTHIVNVVGNTLAAMMKPVEKVAAGGIDLFLSKATKAERSRFIKEGLHDVVGSYSALTNGLGDALKTLIETHSFGQFSRTLAEADNAIGAFTEGMRRENYAREAASKGAEVLPSVAGAIGTQPNASKAERLFGKAVRLPFRSLQAFDGFFKTMNKTAELHSLAYRQAVMEGKSGSELASRMAWLVKMPSDEMLEAATKKSYEYVFQEELGKIMSPIGKARNQVPMSKFIIPFFNTPINLTKFSTIRSPLGILSPRNWKDIMKSSGTRADALARVGVGSAITAGVMGFFAQDKITGAAPKDTAARDKFYREGKLPYAVKIGDTWYQYQRLEPLATYFALAANIQDKLKNEDEKDWSGLVGEFIFEASKHVTDQTFLVGLSDWIDAIMDPERNGKKFIQQLATGQVPRIFPGVANMMDRTYRQPETLGESMKTQIPFLSQTVRSKLNAFGEANKRQGSSLSELSPIKASKAKTDKVDQELDRLGITIGFPSSSITRSGHKVKLSPDMEHDYIRVSGRTIKNVLDKVVETPAWEKASDEEREKLINKTITDVREKTADIIFIDAELERLKYGDIGDNSTKRAAIKELLLDDRYSDLTDEQRKKVIDKILK